MSDGPGYFKHPTALVESDQVGDGTNVWAYAHVMKGAVVGSRCNIGDHSFVETGAVVGDEVTVKNGVSVWAHVTVKNKVFLGPNAALTNDMRPRSRQKDWTPVPTVFEEGATIGANATIVCGCHVGRYAFVGAGAVVIRPVPPHAVVVGNPARPIGFVCECGQAVKGRGKTLTCARCGKAYRKAAAGLERADTPAPPSAGPPAAPKRVRRGR
jgi:UDP-2-acetamido-3-amino-2,3-dideoxy-glucuronate N-acetyltransferase